MRCLSYFACGLSALALACGGDDGGSASTDAAQTDGTPGGADGGGGGPDAPPGCMGAPPDLALDPVVSGLDDLPTYVTAPAGDDRLFIVSQSAGTVRILDGSNLVATPFLDLSGLIGTPEFDDEEGLLGVAFHPDYSENGRFFVTHTNAAQDAIVLAEYEVSGNPDVADAASREELISIPVSSASTPHYGGHLAFGPDGMLYVGVGDNSNASNARNTDNLLGSILRYDVSTADSAVPAAGNPFIGGAGADAVWAYGLRVPWRYSFDRSSGDLYVGDVGASDYEEISYVKAGDPAPFDFGWDVTEGAECSTAGCDKGGILLPIHAYAHAGSSAVMGGYAYRGDAMPCHQGTYFYSDFVGRWVKSFQLANGQAVNHRTWDGLAYNAGSGGWVSFGEDGAGELYLVDLEGMVAKIIPGS